METSYTSLSTTTWEQTLSSQARITKIEVTYTAAPAYTITATSNNYSYGTVSVIGSTITATPENGYWVVAGDDGYTVTSGTATVVNNGNNTFTVTPKENCTVQVNFEAIPTHTATFCVNGETTSKDYQEDASIAFPTAVETTPGDGEFAKVVNGKTFVGWYTAEYNDASDAPDYVNTTTATMNNSDVKYYAVYAEVTEEESDDPADAVKSQRLEYDTWSYSGSTTDKSKYRLFHTNSYIESAVFDLSKLIKVVVYGGTFGGGSYNSLTIGDGTNTWKNVTVSGSSETGTNTYTDGTALSGTNKLRITCNSGTADKTGVRISMVEIFVKGTVTTTSNFTTDARAAAGISFDEPEVSVKLTSGYSGQALINPNSVAVTYSSSDASVATVNSSTGAVTELLKAGTTTITASFAGNATYMPAEVSYELTVTEKTPHGLSYEVSEVKKLTTDAAFTNTLTNGNSLTVAYTSSDTNVATVNTSTGEVTIQGAGTATITATFAGDATYEAGDASYTLTVKALDEPNIVVANVGIAWGETFTVDDSVIEGGAITVTSGNTNIATVDGLVITSVACGEVEITVSTAENETYKSGSETFTLTITAPEARTIVSDNVLFNETFASCDGTGGNKTGAFSNGNQNGSVEGKTDETYSTITSAYPANGCARLGTGSGNGVLTTTVSITGNATLTFSGAGWSGSDTNTIKVTATGATLSGDTDVTLTNAVWNDYIVNISGATGSVVITFTEKRGFLDDIKITQTPSTTVKLNKYGYATFCSENPMDFSSTEGYTAWRVNDIEGSTVTFTKITEAIKGGQGVLLYNKDADGESTSNVTVNFANGTTEFAAKENLLVGTLAPTYVTAGEYYGLSGQNFVPVAASTVPDGKALLPASALGGGSVKAFNFVFEDNATGIRTVETVSPEEAAQIFDLSGRRLNKIQKGINIVNGKKVLY